MESCERIKSNTLRINFDTMQKDKQERVYCVENALCQVYGRYIAIHIETINKTVYT